MTPEEYAEYAQWDVEGAEDPDAIIEWVVSFAEDAAVHSAICARKVANGC